MKFLYDLNPVQHFVADAMGEPGKRTFFLQGRAGRESISLVMEKQQIGGMANALLQLIEDISEKLPDLPPAMINRKQRLKLEQPVDPTFRVAQINIGYDEEDDMVWIIAKAMVVNNEGELIDPDRDDVPSARFVATRSQIRALAEHALETVSAGRPTCTLCGRPIDRDGHFCPRADGHANLIIFQA